MSPGGNYVAAGSADSHIFIWNTMTTRLEKILQKGGLVKIIKLYDIIILEIRLFCH